MENAPRTMKLRIAPVVLRAEEIQKAVEKDLPTHQGLKRAAEGVADAAREAERVSRQLKRPWSMHRIPFWFLLASSFALAIWCYYEFVHVTTLKVAVPNRDAVTLREKLRVHRNVKVEQVEVTGSRAAIEQLQTNLVDLAFVQGGIDIPASFSRLELPRSEWLILMTRGNLSMSQANHILTSTENQGSHTVALDYFGLFGRESEVTFHHDWSRLTSEEQTYEIAPEIDGVFVVKDLTEIASLRAIERLQAEGFSIQPVGLGARGQTLEYLQFTDLPAGFISPAPMIPATDLETAQVKTYLVAREGLTPRLLASAAHLLDAQGPSITESSFELDVDTTFDVLQGIDAVLSIIVYIGVAFLTLLGLEVLTYRKRFNSLNTLVSLISIHQSNKDVLGLKDPRERQANLLYLSTCSDLLGLVGVIAGYYAQENGALLYNGLLSIVGERADALRLNIQLKILHASVETLAPVQLQTETDTIEIQTPSIE